MGKLAPIVVFTYNRPWHTAQTIRALRKNKFAEQSDLIIYSDGPKSLNVRDSVNETREYIKKVTGFKAIKIIERENNWGLANSIISGVTEVADEYGKVIVLEDDMLTSPYFLSYMNSALDLYDNHQQVASIHAYTYPIENLPETFFLKGADCWGWATWKDRWSTFEPDGQVLLDELKSRRLTKAFDLNGHAQYINMLQDQINGSNDSWAIRWHASAFLNDMLTLYPGVSYVQNIGHDEHGTHCGDSTDFDVKLNTNAVLIKKIEVKENTSALRKFEIFFAELKPNFTMKLYKKIMSLIS